MAGFFSSQLCSLIPACTWSCAWNCKWNHWNCTKGGGCTFFQPETSLNVPPNHDGDFPPHTLVHTLFGCFLTGWNSLWTHIFFPRKQGRSTSFFTRAICPVRSMCFKRSWIGGIFTPRNTNGWYFNKSCWKRRNVCTKPPLFWGSKS